MISLEWPCKGGECLRTLSSVIASFRKMKVSMNYRMFHKRLISAETVHHVISMSRNGVAEKEMGLQKGNLSNQGL